MNTKPGTHRIGTHAWSLRTGGQLTVVAQHPRSGFKREFARVYREEAARVPPAIGLR